MALPTNLGQIRTRQNGYERRAAFPAAGLIVLVVIGAALAGGAVTGMFGLMAVPLAGAALMAVFVMMFGVEIWWRLLVILLFGYAFASRGFASIGFYPFYIGEIVLALGLLTVAVAPFSDRIRMVNAARFISWPILLLLLFVISQLLQTIPYIGTYQFDALRDAMVYGYAIFAILVMMLISSRRIEQFVQLYGRMIPLLLVWFPIFFFVSRISAINISFPGSDVPLIYTKGSDVAVHLGGIAAFILLGMDDKRSAWPRWLTWVLWGFWVTSMAFYGALGRAALLTGFLSVAIVLGLRPLGTRWAGPLVLMVFFLSLLLATNTFYSFRIDFGLHREISAEQFTYNITSVFGGAEGSELDGTRRWRLEWWDEIVDYTFGGPFFWTGKGYGVNLADEDGFQVDPDAALRSPHNGHLTLLARSGVPGFLLWVAFLISVLLMLVREALVNQSRHPWRSRFAIWLLAYLMAHVLMTGFDVYLEGPMGGIWFWTKIGFALAYFRDPPQAEAETPDQSESTLPFATGASSNAYRSI
jgi:hypothetical protein